jgi:hypothetical protein
MAKAAPCLRPLTTDYQAESKYMENEPPVVVHQYLEYLWAGHFLVVLRLEYC